MESIDYKSKYLKYKKKYLELKCRLQHNNLKSNIKIYHGGRSNNLIIHISGSPGVGKTSLGNKIQEHYHDKIVVTDIDKLLRAFMTTDYKDKHFDKNKYQKVLDEYILKQTKPLVLVGMNIMVWNDPKKYYNVHSEYNFCIDATNQKIFKQRCARFLNKTIEKKETLFDKMIKYENKTILKLQKKIKEECGYNNIKKFNDKLHSDYKKQGYIFLSQSDIYDEVLKIIDAELNKTMSSDLSN
jgi:translation elongation factor EF-G